MLTTIQRRIARDIIVMFCTSLFVITFLVMCIGVLGEAMNQGLGFAGLFRLIPYALPNALSLAVPGTALFSVCSVYGRMSSDNEFTAMQAVGISIMPAVWPAIILTSLLSIATVTLINVAFTWGFHGIQKVVFSSVENIAYGVLRQEHRFQRDQFSLQVLDVDGKNLIEPSITITRTGTSPITINARNAVLRYDDLTESIEFSITNGRADVGEQASFTFPDTFTQRIPLNSAADYNLLTANPSHMPMRDLPSASMQQTDAIAKLEHEIAVSVGFNLLLSRPEETFGPTALARNKALNSNRDRLHRLGTEMHRRWASGFTCLAMSMLGIPLAIRMKASDSMTTFGVVFLPTVLIYYPIFALTLDLAKDGHLASAGVWIANLLFISVSIVLIRKLAYKAA